MLFLIKWNAFLCDSIEMKGETFSFVLENNNIILSFVYK